METMLVTGGAGFIGCNFVRYALAHTEARVIVIDKLTYAGSSRSLDEVAHHPRFALTQVDIGDRREIDALFAQYQPTALVNFAAETHVDRSIDDSKPFVETNVGGTVELLEATRTFLSTLKRPERSGFRFVHISTDEVYGTLGASGAFVETTPYAPNSPYAASKAAADHFVRAYHETYGLPTLNTNCSNDYGPYQFPEKLIPLMLLNAIEGQQLPIYGDGGHVRDWLYVEDHCAGILLVLQHGRIGEKYNIGGGGERTNLQVLERLCSLLEALLPSASNPALVRQGIAGYDQLKTFVQDNQSRLVYSIIRGLHAQQRRPQGKLIRVIEGEIFDVAVDIRRGSPTFLHWVVTTLSAQNFRQCYIPPGFAHGFCVTSAAAQIEYKCTDFYDPADEIHVRWDDPDIDIKWPLDDPILSPKDRAASFLRDDLERLPILEQGPR